MKSLLCEAPILSALCYHKHFVQYGDAQQVGVGAVLMQPDEQGTHHPVRFFSRKFNRNQLNYSVIVQEAFKLIWVLQPFEVEQNSCTFLYMMQNSNQQLMHWCLFFQEYSLQIRHVRSQENMVADTLSHTHK